MVDRDAEFLKKLLALLTPSNTSSTAPLLAIQKDVDIALVNAMGQWLRSQCEVEPLKLGKVLASLCYHVAFCIAKESDNEDHACMLSQAYADYLHQITHTIYTQHCATSKK